MSIADSNCHLLKYSYLDLYNDTYIYPFTLHDRWMHQAQNTAKWHRINGQWNIYLKKHLEDANLTEEVLKNILDDEGKELEKII